MTIPETLHLTLRQLQVFLAIVRGGTTVAAGGQIGLSQSATSAALGELERMLGLPLFDRCGRRLLLNDNGRALLPRARALLDGAHEIEQLARQAQPSLASLRIGASTTMGNHVLPRLLRLWRGDWLGDGVQPWHARIVIGNTARICAAVADFALDVGLIEGPCDEPRLEVRPWLSDELLVVAAPEVLSRLVPARTPSAVVPVQALRQELWLLREAGSGTRVATDLALQPHLQGYTRALELGNSEAIKHAAVQGLGLACLSEWVVADDMAAARLVRVSTTLPRLRRQCYLVMHRDKQPTDALTRLVQRLESVRLEMPRPPAGGHPA